MQPTIIITILFAICFLYYTTGFAGFYVIGTLIFILLLLVYFYQNKLLYMPAPPQCPQSPSQNQRGYRNPSQQGLKYVDVNLKTQDNIKLKGWHVKAQQPQRIIVYFQQNAGNIGNRIPFMKYLSSKTSSDVILVAYRGYSDSQGSPSQPGLKKDSQAILNYAIQCKKQSEKKLPIFVLGRSLGGAVTVHISTRPYYKDAISGLVLENTFTSIGDMIDQVMPIFKYLKFLQTNHWKSIERIPEITVPILFVKSMRDQLVPPKHMDRLINNSNSSSKVEVYQIPYGNHNSSWDIDPDQYFSRLLSYFKSAV